MPPRSQPRQPIRRPGPILPGSWIALILLGVIAVAALVPFPAGSKSIKYSEFLEMVRKDQVKKVELYGTDRLEGEVKDPSDEALKDLNLPSGRFATLLPPAIDRAQFIENLFKQHNIEVEVKPEPAAWLGPFLMTFLPTMLILGLLIFFMMPRVRDPLGGGFLNSYVKSPAKRYEKTRQAVTFADVAGMESTKRELQEVVDFLRSPEKFQRLGAQVPKGVLLVGPPGTGKTLLAKAVAGEAGVPFFSINGSEFIQMFVGVGASRVRDLFKTAREAAPCLLFIDEIDAVGRMRGAGVGGGSDEREQTLNQILSEMDGFQPTETVIVLAATNRPDVLDSALLRPGRFDRHITIDRPNWQGRLAILKVHTRNKPLADDVDLETLAKKMIGMTGADLRNLANEAALLATRENKTKIDKHDFENAADRVLRGPKREEVLTEEGKRRTAYHEAGHALLCWLEPNADKPIKVSVIPRGRSLGVTQNLPEEDRYYHGVAYFKSQLLMMMGGRAADRLVFGEADAGAEMDLKQATRLARYMVTHWGMSDRLGPMSFRIGEEHVFLGKEIQEPRDFSEGTAQIIDEEVQKLLREADERAFQLLKDNRADLDKLAEELVRREEMDRDEIEQLLSGKESNNGHSTVVSPGAAAG